MKALKSARAEERLTAARAIGFSHADRLVQVIRHVQEERQRSLDAARARVQAAGGPTLGQLLAEFEAVGCKV